MATPGPERICDSWARDFPPQPCSLCTGRADVEMILWFLCLLPDSPLSPAPTAAADGDRKFPAQRWRARAPGCRDGGQARPGPLGQLREAGGLGSCALQCNLAGNRQGKQMPSDSWEEWAGKLQWWQEAGSLPHPVVLSGGYLWLWCPMLWDRVVLWVVETVGAFNYPSHRGCGGGIKQNAFRMHCNNPIPNLAESFLHPDRV